MMLLALALRVSTSWILPSPPTKARTRRLSSLDGRDTETMNDIGRERIRRKIRLHSGEDANVISRTFPVTSNWSITIWEWEKPASVVESYWDAQLRNAGASRDGRLLDPFGLVSWPGSFVAAQELLKHRNDTIENKTVLVLGAGVGVEAQASAMLGAKRVIATDIHPTTLRLLEFGAQQACLDEIIEARVLDFCSQQPLPRADVFVAADVLYNEQLASQVCRRCAEALVQNPAIKILVTDSQRFVDFTTELNKNLQEVQKGAYRPVQWDERTLPDFTGSGVSIDEDQTYNVKVRVLWINA
jgi:predicted nicotinamide N-methyase